MEKVTASLWAWNQVFEKNAVMALLYPRRSLDLGMREVLVAAVIPFQEFEGGWGKTSQIQESLKQSCPMISFHYS